MSAHTPGPWRRGTHYESVVADSCPPERQHGNGCESDDRSGGPCEDVSSYGGHLVAESIFHAPDLLLVAAAPELLAATVATLEEIFRPGSPADLPAEIITAMQAAVAKARGEQP